MAFPAVNNVTGSNPGPNYAVLPDTIQMPVGNVRAVFRAALTSITPAILATGPSINVQTFASTGIGLLTTDAVTIEYVGLQTANVAVLDARVSATDTLEIKFLATAGTPTPAAATNTNPYVVSITRVQPNWTNPGTGSQITF